MHHYYFILYATVPTMLLYIPPGCLSIPQTILPIPMSVSIISFNSLIPICLLAGIKNYCSVEFLRRNSPKKSLFFKWSQNHF